MDPASMEAIFVSPLPLLTAISAPSENLYFLSAGTLCAVPQLIPVFFNGGVGTRADRYQFTTTWFLAQATN